MSTGQSVTYSTFYKGVRNLAAGLRGLGVATDDRIALMVPNRMEFLQTWFAATYLGTLHVPVNTFLKGGLLAYLLNDSLAGAIVIDPQYVERLLAVAADLPRLETVLVCGDLDPSQSKELAAGFDVRHFDDVASVVAEATFGPADREPALGCRRCHLYVWHNGAIEGCVGSASPPVGDG